MAATAGPDGDERSLADEVATLHLELERLGEQLRAGEAAHAARLRALEQALAAAELDDRLARLEGVVDEVQAALRRLEAAAGPQPRPRDRPPGPDAEDVGVTADRRAPPRLRVPPPPRSGVAAPGPRRPAAGGDDDAREALIARVLEVTGVGRRRAGRLAARFGDLPTLCLASPEDVAAVADLAEHVADEVLAVARAEFTARLLEVPGIGRARAEAVAAAYGHPARLAAADADEVAATCGLPDRLAVAVVAHVRA